ncbi:RNA-binding protein 45 [Armadillidium nasatum]|uniref:RNA-binding protein 45 n=1 Tax=Armadillidium nasatum TaxID=96803 RepID=A0A5N5SJF2_9CRUS|nr:RNA-binding protein 45 [Armadillidium nasatum]
MSSSDKGSRRHDSRESRDSYHMHNSEGRFNKESKYDDPPHSRLFIVCGKSITEEDFREHFSKYGTIEEIWVVKDRVTEEPKGVTYIKFSKTSEAALAMEEMNGRCIGNHPRPLKVLIAHSREQGSRREINEEERLLRLFVVVPKTLNESDLREHFSQFGDIDYVSIVRERGTRESKGFGYVKYHRMSHTAKAFENCDRSFKPVFADPKPQKDSKMDVFRGNNDMREMRNDGFGVDSGGLNPDGVTRLTVIASPSVNQDQLWRLFDLIPGLDYCDLRKDRKSGQTRGVANVVYNNIQSATYARDKLHGFEYPPGQRLIVKLDGHSHHDMPQCSGAPSLALVSANAGGGARPPPNNIQQDLATQLAETIAQATSLIQAAGLSQQGGSSGAMIGSPSSGGVGETYNPSYCSVKLPPPQPLAPVDSQVVERLFIVCHPSPPPLYALKDVFGRFGNLIDIYMLNGKTFGYAKYASKESADKAIMVLHGQEVLGARMKVMEADPHDKNDSGRKRLRMDDQN